MTTVAGLFPDRATTERAIQALQAAGFNPDRIGIVMRDQREARDVADQTNVVNSAAGAVTGGVVGGALGAILAATGALVIPGIGPFVAGGILATALVGGVAGWLVGGLVALGIPHEEAEYYQGQVEQGRVLVTVDAGDQEEQARAVFMQSGAENLRESPSVNDAPNDAYESVTAATQPVDAATTPATSTTPAAPVTQGQSASAADPVAPVAPPSGVYSDMSATNPTGTPTQPLPNEQTYAAQQSDVPTEPTEPAEGNAPHQRVILPPGFAPNPQAARSYGVGGAPDSPDAPDEGAGNREVGSSAPTDDAVPLAGQAMPRSDTPATDSTSAPDDPDGEPRITRDDDIIRQEQRRME